MDLPCSGLSRVPLALIFHVFGSRSDSMKVVFHAHNGTVLYETVCRDTRTTGGHSRSLAIETQTLPAKIRTSDPLMAVRAC